MDRRPGPTTRAAPRAPRDLHLESASESNRTTPTDASPNAAPTTWVFTKRLGLRRVAQPNGSRLSCGAELERSQIKGYHRGRGADSFKRLLGCAPSVVAPIWPSHRGPRSTIPILP